MPPPEPLAPADEEQRSSPLSRLAERGVLAVARLPRSWLAKGAPLVGRAIAAGATGRRVREGLAFAYGPTLPGPRLGALTHDVCTHLALLGCEFGEYARATPEIIRARVDASGHALMDQALSGGKGVILLTAHIGNWEWSLAGLSQELPTTLVANRVGRGPLQDAVKAARQRLGVEVVDMEDGRSTLAALKRNRVLVLAADRRVRRGTAVCVPFFGNPASCVTGPARLAMATGAAVVAGGGRRLQGGGFEVKPWRVLPLIRTGDKERDIWLNTARQQFALEEAIRAVPDQWIWQRRRWLLRRDEPGPDYGDRLRLLAEHAPEVQVPDDWRRWTQKKT